MCWHAVNRAMAVAEIVLGRPRPGGGEYVAGIATLLPDGTASVLVAEAHRPLDDQRALYEMSVPVGLLTQLVVQQRTISDLEREVQRHAQKRSLLAATLHHDLRAPLTAIVGSAQTVRARWHLLPEDQRDELLGCVERQAARLQHMVTENLRTEVTAPHAPPRLRVSDLGQLARRAAAAAELSRTGEIVVEGRGVTITTDEDRLERALLNLLDNALKYSPPGVPVHLIVEERGPGAVITVADNGPGVDDTVLPRLFGPYSTDPGRPDGTGLGLHSARSLLDDLGARVTYARHSGWSRFVVTIPDHRAEACA